MASENAPTTVAQAWEHFVCHLIHMQPLTAEARNAILVHLRKSEADTISDDGTCHFVFSKPIVAPPEYLLFASLQQASIPNSFYNVNSTNNAINVTESIQGGATIERSLYLPEGNYAAENGTLPLTTALQDMLNHGGNVTYHVTFSNTTGRLKITTSTVNATVLFQFGSTPNTCRLALGFSESDHVLTTTSALMSDRVCDLTGGNHDIVVRSSLQTHAVLTSHGEETNALFHIPITAKNFEMITFKDTDSDFRCLLSHRRIFAFTIQLTNPSGTLLDFNGADWSICIQFTYVRIRSPSEMHPIEAVVARTREQVMLDADLQDQIDRVTENLHRIHDALPLLRRQILRRRDELIEDYERRNTLTQDNLSGQ